MVIHFSIVKWLLVLQSVKVKKGILDDKLIVQVWQVHFLLGIEITETIRNCVLVPRTQPLIGVGCSVHYWVSCAIIKVGFSEIAFVVVNPHLPRFEALAYVLPHFDALTHVVIRASSAFIFQTFAEVCYSVLVNCSSFKSVLNLRKAYIFKSLLKVYYRSVFNESSKAFIFQSVLKVYTLSKILL